MITLHLYLTIEEDKVKPYVHVGSMTQFPGYGEKPTETLAENKVLTEVLKDTLGFAEAVKR